MKTEPVVTIASITAAVAALIALLTAFGVPLSDDQQKAILALVAVAAPLVAAVLARRHVTPESKLVTPEPPADTVARVNDERSYITGAGQ